MKKQSEKRESVRFRVPTLLKYSGDPHSAGEQVANIRDISLRGMAFLAQKPVEEGCHLELSFLTPSGEALVVKGLVLHCEKISKNPDSFKVGVCFEEVQHEALEWLRRFEKFFLDGQKMRNA